MLIILTLLILLFSSIAIVIKADINFAKFTSRLALGISSLISLIILILSLRGNDQYSTMVALMCIFFNFIGFLIIWASASMVDYEIKKKRIPIYYSLMLTLIASLCGIVFFDNLLIVFIFVELSAFLASGIVIIKDEPENYRAGLKYLMLSMFASVFLLIGIVILYRLTGTVVINQMILANLNIELLKYAFIFIFIGVAFKSALFPFHIWLPDAHGSAPSTSSAILSALVVKSYIILFIKIIYVGFGIELVKGLNILPIILILGVCAMMYGSILAIMQRRLKSRIAYSSVAQIGYIFMGIGLGTPLGLMASMFHIIAHGVTKACLFLCAGRIINSTGLKRTEDMNGLGKSLPITIALYTICSLSMVGIPLFVGFVSKWNFAISILEYNKISLIFVLSISSLLNGIYFLPLAIKSYFTIDDSRERKMNLEPKGQYPVIILGLLVIVTGVFSSPLIDLLNNIVQRLI